MNDLFEPNLKAKIGKALSITKKDSNSYTESDQETLFNVLQSISFFQNKFSSRCDMSHFKSLMMDKIELEFAPAGKVLLNEGNGPDKFFIIVSGHIMRIDMKPINSEKEKSDASPSSAHESKLIRRNTDRKSIIGKWMTRRRQRSRVLDNESSLISGNSSLVCSPKPSDSRDDIYGDDFQTAASKSNKHGNLKSLKLSTFERSRKHLSLVFDEIIEDLPKNETGQNYKAQSMLFDEKDPFLIENGTTIQNILQHDTIKREDIFYNGKCRIKKFQSYFQCDYFGENFHYFNRIKNNYLIAYEDTWMITVSRNSFLNVLDAIFEEKKLRKKFALQMYSDSVDEFLDFLGLFTRIHTPRNKILYSKDETADLLYILIEGEIILESNVNLPDIDPLKSNTSYRLSKNKVKLTTISEGQFFGEESILNYEKRKFTASSGAFGAICYTISGLEFTRLSLKYPNIIQNLIQASKDKFDYRNDSLLAKQKFLANLNNSELTSTLFQNKNKPRAITMKSQNNQKIILPSAHNNIQNIIKHSKSQSLTIKTEPSVNPMRVETEFKILSSPVARETVDYDRYLLNSPISPISSEMPSKIYLSGKGSISPGNGIHSSNIKSAYTPSKFSAFNSRENSIIYAETKELASFTLNSGVNSPKSHKKINNSVEKRGSLSPPPIDSFLTKGKSTVNKVSVLKKSMMTKKLVDTIGSQNYASGKIIIPNREKVIDYLASKHNSPSIKTMPLRIKQMFPIQPTQGIYLNTDTEEYRTKN